MFCHDMMLILYTKDNYKLGKTLSLPYHGQLSMLPPLLMGRAAVVGYMPFYSVYSN